MLTVKTFIKDSGIHGLGCFAGEDIKKGQVVWRFDQGIDLLFTKEDLRKLPPSFTEFLKIYGYTPLAGPEGNFVLCVDHARHMNHSENPNLMETDEGENVALRDILKGEELTCDYRDFDQEVSKKLAGNN